MSIISTTSQKDTFDPRFDDELRAMERMLLTQKQKSKYEFKGVLRWDWIAEEYLTKTKIITLNGTEEMYYYDELEGIYKPDAECKISAFCEAEIPDISNNGVREVIGHIKRRTFVHREDVGKDKSKIHLQNGIFDLNEMKLLPFSPDIISFTKFPIVYDANAKCDAFLKFLSEVVRPADIPLIQEFFGYCFWRGYPIHKAFMLIGEGRNGKSTLLTILRNCIGAENVCAVSLQELEDRFVGYYFYEKFANIYADIPAKPLRETGKFKMLTGEDSIIAEKKNQMGFLFTNFAKMIFSCNKLPEVADDTTAFFRRWIIINFPNKFEEGDADICLAEKLSTPQELSGIFNWAMVGLKRLLAQKRFSTTITPEQMGEIYKRMSNSLWAFVSDCVELSADNYISKSEFYNKYVDYCTKNNLPVKTKEAVGRELGKHIAVTETWQGRERCWYGIKVSPQQAQEKVPTDCQKSVVSVVNSPQEKNNTLTTQISYSIPSFTQKLPIEYEKSVVSVVGNNINNNSPQETKVSLPKTFNRNYIRQWILDFMSNGELIGYDEMEYYFRTQHKEVSDNDLLVFKAVFDELLHSGEIYEPKPNLYRRLH